MPFADRSRLVLLLLLLCAGAASAGERVRLATLDWEPYVGQRLPEQGYVAALVRAAYAEQGVTVELEFYPWSRALMMARAGTVDGLLPEYYDASRASEFEFSDPFPGGPIGLYKRRGAAIAFAVDPRREPVRALRGFEHLRFGVVRDYLNTPEFDAADWLQKDIANSDEINLRKLAFGRIDLIVIDSLVARHLLRTRLPGYEQRVEPLLPPLAEQKPLHVAYSRRSPRLAFAVQSFNAGLAALAADGRLSALRRRHGMLDAAPSADDAPNARPGLRRAGQPALQ